MALRMLCSAGVRDGGEPMPPSREEEIERDVLKGRQRSGSTAKYGECGVHMPRAEEGGGVRVGVVVSMS